MRDKRLLEFAKSMRREMTEPEKRLWHQLRAQRFEGTKFRRQNVVGRYIADFYSRGAMLIIEVDGDTHAFQEDYDRVREDFFHGLGLAVLRFTNIDVMANMDGVLTIIAQNLRPPLPTLSPEGERAL